MSPVKSPEELTPRVAGKKDKIVVEIDEAEKLPPGWTKEVKIRKSGSATKVDRFYTDPVTGYIFRSLRDAQRYLKTGELGRLAIKPKNNEFVDMDNKDETLYMEERKQRIESKEQMSEALRRKRPLDKTRSKFSETGEPELIQGASKLKRIAGTNIDSPLPSPPVPEPKTHQATPLAGVIVDTSSQPSPLTPEPKTREAKRVSVIIDNESSLPQPKTLRATRQAGLKIDSPPDTRNSQQATAAKLVNLAPPKENDQQTKADNITDKHTENVNMDNDANDNQEETIIPPVNHESNKKQEHNKEMEMGPATLLDQATPTTVLRVDSEKQKSPTVSNPIVDKFWTDPCIEFAVKTLTGAIPFGDLNDFKNFTPQPLQVWTDPYIQFAAKTLTGAGEDDCLPASSRNPRAPHEFRLPDTGMSFFQTGVLSKGFETEQNSAFGSGGLQKSGNICFRDPGSFSKF